MPLPHSYPTPTSPAMPYPQSPNTDQTTSVSAAPHGTLPPVFVKVEERESSHPLSPLNHRTAETPERNDNTNIPPSSSLTPKTKGNGKERRADRTPEGDSERDSKRRRIDHADQLAETSTQGAQVDIASTDLPAWRVKVENTPAEEERNKPMEDGEDIDELRDEDISRASRGMTDHAGPSTSAVPSSSAPLSTNAQTPPAPSTSPAINAGHLRYVYNQVGDKLVCLFCT